MQLPAYLSLYYESEFLLLSATGRIKVSSKHGTPVLTSYNYTFPLYTTISSSAALHDPSLQQGSAGCELSSHSAGHDPHLCHLSTMSSPPAFFVSGTQRWNEPAELAK